MSLVAEGEQADDSQLPPGVARIGAGCHEIGLILHAHILNHPGYGPPIAARELGPARGRRVWLLYGPEGSNEVKDRRPFWERMALSVGRAYQQAFGILSLVIVVMTYLYIASVAFLVGAELDALAVAPAGERSRRRGARR
jgi:hypothetical protein